MSTKDRILEASSELFGRQGYVGTGIKAILTASNAPYASLYHFFPGGKEELGAAAIRTAGDGYRRLVEAVYNDTADPVTATRDFFDGAAALLEVSDFADACPIATVALEIASSSEVMRQAAAEAFDSWLVVLENCLVGAGLASARARELAITAFCAIEGAFILSRTTRTVEPMRIARELVATAITESLVAQKKRSAKDAARRNQRRASKATGSKPKR